MVARVNCVVISTFFGIPQNFSFLLLLLRVKAFLTRTWLLVYWQLATYKHPCDVYFQFYSFMHYSKSHLILFRKLISAGLHPCFKLNLSFLISAVVWFFKITKVDPRVSRGLLGPVLFSIFINDHPASLTSFVSCSLHADNLAIRSSSPRSQLLRRPHNEP